MIFCTQTEYAIKNFFSQVSYSYNNNKKNINIYIKKEFLGNAREEASLFIIPF